jgi:hypothetical protein
MRVRALLPVALLVSAACSSDPTGGNTPPPPPPPSEYFLKVEVSSIVVRAMCDGFPVDINGGEWSHKLEVRFPGEGSNTMGETGSFPNPQFYKSAGNGGTLALDPAAKTIARVQQSEEGDQVTLTIRATEWDYDILGNNPFPDSRMNNRAATSTFTFSDGAWTEVPSGVLKLQNATSGAACAVDVNYKFEAVKQ